MNRVTLTFDNGPTPGTTPYVLEELERRGLSAYFCLVGKQLAAGNEQLDVAKQIQADGHLLVNHSLTHGVALGDDPSASHARREIAQMHALMTESLGDWGESRFRPFGRGGELGQHIFSPAAVAELSRLNYSVVLWNCVPRDWEDPRGWVETALEQIEGSTHAVVVLHDLATGAMDQLPRFLDALLMRQADITMTLPDDCVPMRDGRIAWSDAGFAKLVAPANTAGARQATK